MLGYFRQNLGGYIKNNIVAYFFVTLIFVIGIVVGALAVRTLPDEQKTELISYLHIFFTGLTQGTENNISGTTMISSVMFNNIKTIALMWILGFTIVGIPFVLFILFTRGFIIGFTVGFLVMGVSATKFSLLLVRRKTYGKVNLWYEALRYSILCMVMLVAMLVAALLEVYISPVFMKLVASLLIGD